MKKEIFTATVAAALNIAQQVNGATVSGAFQSVESDFIGDFDVTSFAVSLDFAITPGFAVGADIKTIGTDDFIDDRLWVRCAVFTRSPQVPVSAHFIL